MPAPVSSPIHPVLAELAANLFRTCFAFRRPRAFIAVVGCSEGGDSMVSSWRGPSLPAVSACREEITGPACISEVAPSPGRT